MGKLFINHEEYLRRVLEYIDSDDMKKAFDITVFSKYPDADNCYEAMKHGIIWASALASQCHLYEGEIVDENLTS